MVKNRIPKITSVKKPYIRRLLAGHPSLRITQNKELDARAQTFKKKDEDCVNKIPRIKHLKRPLKRIVKLFSQ